MYFFLTYTNNTCMQNRIHKLPFKEQLQAIIPKTYSYKMASFFHTYPYSHSRAHQLSSQVAQQRIFTVVTSHLLVEFCNKTTAKTLSVVQKPSSHVVTLVPSLTLAGLHPVAGGKISRQPYKICNSLC
ncbi:unnamed protein product, partial [Vitis vinifera]